ncbi:MAG TPA: penicillin acylase family protein [Candidatus Nitrosotalea sp.]|nr:penicillin acylase family protein [Candidatus Nitrosotalea sp.]
MKSVTRALAVALALILLVTIFFGANVVVGMHAHAREEGTISGLPLHAPVSVLRDDRGVPHIIAANDHDLFFAQGYVEGADRLFQMDLLRRFTLGELAEVFGSGALETDESERAVPVRAMVEAQYRRLDSPSREILNAFADGVNAAIAREPLPVEFRLMAYRPRAWTPQDSLAVGMATVLDLIDDWNAIAPRDAAYRSGGKSLLDARFPLTDPCYDAPVLAGLAGIGPGPRCHRPRVVLLHELGDARAPVGSNEWAAGANRSITGRALLANDPHLGIRMPGVWYLVDLHSPAFHVAGASLPGLPAVVLGHNENLAWGATSGTVTSLSVFRAPAHLDPARWETERFEVRFRQPLTMRYYRAPGTFGITTDDKQFVLVKWDAYANPSSPATTFIALDRAASIEQARTALASYPGPTQNFVLADTSGRAAYQLAGEIPNDPVRARWFHSAADLAREYPMIPFTSLPKIAPSRDAVLWTANNRVYGAKYQFALSPQFAPPYRAYRIAQLLRARARYDVPYFAAMQMDALSLPERELARALAPAVQSRDADLSAALAGWNGEMDGSSTTATVVAGVRLQLTRRHNGRLPTLLAIAGSMHALPQSVALPSPAPWGVAGAVPVLHSLAKLGVNFLNGVVLPGYGDAFTLHVQTPGYTQSFRAIWDIGNWDAGGITLPQGESGEPGSGQYTDQASAWISGKIWTLPFSDDAVRRTAIDRETLSP